MKKALMMLLVGLTLTACSEYTVEELAENDDLRIKILEECQNMPVKQLKKEEKCQIATQAQIQKLTGGALKFSQ